MNLNEITNKLKEVIDIYSEKFKIKKGDDWYVLKIQEELGELTSAYLKLTSRARRGDSTDEELAKNLNDEIADVIAMTLLFAQSRNIDVEQVLKNKWFKYLK